MFDSPEYPTKAIKITQKYPEELQGLCPLCKCPVEFEYNTAEKKIYQLTGPIIERRHLVTCTNDDCKLCSVPFNPSPRFDYSHRSYGKDVLAKIGDYYISETYNPRQIHAILKREYALPISESTVARICNDILVLTSFHIDENTAKIIKEQDFLLIALDGQEPDGDRPALWNFADLISGRVLITKYLDQVDHLVLHKCVEELKNIYEKPIIGFVSDKQGAIRKCFEVFYPDIPHQYCTFHFSTNLWNHLEKFTNNIHRKIQKTVKSLYIHTVSTKTQISLPGEADSVSLKKLLKPIDKEMLGLLRKKNKKFQQLKGIEAFERMTNYLEGFKMFINKIPVDDRISKIMKKTAIKLELVLEETKKDYHCATEGFKMFQEVHKLLWKDESDSEIKIKQLNNVFNKMWIRSQEIHSNFSRTDCKSFLPKSDTPYWMILAEWTRLWGSYKPGLFKYYTFPIGIKSNVEMEQKFSTENRRFRSQSGRAHIGQMIETRGEFVLRLQYSSLSDLNFEKIIANSETHLTALRAHLQALITASSKRWTFSEGSILCYIQLLQRIYGLQVTEMAE